MATILHGREHFPHPELPLSVQRYDRIGEIELHGHDFHELVLVVAGRAEHVVVQGRQETVDAVAPGDVFVLAPDERHGYRQVHGFAVYNLLFTAELLRGDGERLRAVPGLADLLCVEPLFRRESRTRHRLRLRPRERVAAEAAAAAVADELERAEPGFAVAARGLFHQLLVILGRAWTRVGGPRGTALAAGQDRALAAAIAFMDEHHRDETLAVAEVAAAAGLSPHWFSAVFAKRTGVSPWQWLTALRIERAKRLLAENELPVIGVALEVGFADASYFARVFRRATGRTPQQWRGRRA